MALTQTERAEREHAERMERRSRVLALERRLDTYRSNVFTPSGRPYESLPIVSLGEMRQQLKNNGRGLAAVDREFSTMLREAR